MIEFLVHHYNCNNCKREVIPTDPELPEVGNLGYALQSEIVHLKFEDRLPLRKILKALNRKFPNLGLVAATILAVLQRATNRLEGAYEDISQRVKTTKAVNADETGAKIQCRKAWFWGVESVFLYGEGKKPIKISGFYFYLLIVTNNLLLNPDTFKYF